MHQRRLGLPADATIGRTGLRGRLAALENPIFAPESSLAGSGRSRQPGKRRQHAAELPVYLYRDCSPRACHCGDRNGIASGTRAAGAGGRGLPAGGPPPLLPGGPPAPAPPSPPVSGLQVTATPHLWLSGVNVAIDTPLKRASTVNTSVGAFQLLGDLDAVPFMGSVEVSDGPFSLLGDAFHVPISTGITTRNILL
jgi:hypothetical protein